MHDRFLLRAPLLNDRISDPIDVIALTDYDRGLVPLLGGKIPMCSLYANYYTKPKQSIASYKDYRYVYMLVDGDARVAEIIRGKR